MGKKLGLLFDAIVLLLCVVLMGIFALKNNWPAAIFFLLLHDSLGSSIAKPTRN